jgi:hypothetical protein
MMQHTATEVLQFGALYIGMITLGVLAYLVHARHDRRRPWQDGAQLKHTCCREVACSADCANSQIRRCCLDTACGPQCTRRQDSIADSAYAAGAVDGAGFSEEERARLRAEVDKVGQMAALDPPRPPQEYPQLQPQDR